MTFYKIFGIIQKKVTGQEAIAYKLVDKALNGDLKAIEMLFDRLEGKPTTTEPHEPINIIIQERDLKIL
jgi:hypothetical protein